MKKPPKPANAIDALLEMQRMLQLPDALRHAIELQKLYEPPEVVRQAIELQKLHEPPEALRRATELQKLYEPPEVVRQAIELQKLYEPPEVVRHAIEVQKTFGPSEGVRQAIELQKTFEASEAAKLFFEGQRALGTPSALTTILEISRLSEGLRAEAVFKASLGALTSTVGLEGVAFRRFGSTTIAEPDDLLDEETIDELELPKKHRDALVRVDRLPLVVLQEVLRDPSRMLHLSPRDFELFIADLLERLGFTDIEVTPRSGDGGRDVLAKKVVSQLPLLFMFECKRYDPTKPVRIETIRALLGASSVRTANVNKAVLVTTSRFTKGGWDLIASEARLGGKDYDGIVEWISDTRKEPLRVVLAKEVPEELPPMTNKSAKGSKRKPRPRSPKQ